MRNQFEFEGIFRKFGGKNELLGAETNLLFEIKI
jgi:hypothetical protein